jgi:hypothetical protein
VTRETRYGLEKEDGVERQKKEGAREVLRIEVEH